MKRGSRPGQYNRQRHSREGMLEQGRGVLRRLRISRMEICGLFKNVLNSSQGTPERRDRDCLRRMRDRLTKGSSIHLFLFTMTVILLTSLSIKVSAEKPDGAEAKIQEVGDNFEALMLQRLYSQMRASNQVVNAGDNNPFAPSHAELIFRGMQEEMLMKNLANRRPLGMGDLVVRQLKGLSGIGARPLLKSERVAHQEGNK